MEEASLSSTAGSMTDLGWGVRSPFDPFCDP